jgi:hypothetical protein
MKGRYKLLGACLFRFCTTKIGPVTNCVWGRGGGAFCWGATWVAEIGKIKDQKSCFLKGFINIALSSGWSGQNLLLTNFSVLPCIATVRRFLVLINLLAVFQRDLKF